VVTAEDGEKGLSLARSEAPDLILMDLSLPGMDGLAATKALRADATICHLTVIALTAHAMKGDEEIALQAGCDGYVVKPIDTRTFIKTITGFLSLAKMRRAAHKAA